ncbi:MAG: transglycosylase family protein [Candidatus Nanopelagicales bacterium]
MSKALIAAPAAVMVAASALTVAPMAMTAADAAPSVQTYKKGRPVTAAHFRHYHLKNWELKQIAKAQKWAKTPKSRSVIRCESGFDYKMIDGPYKGAWQFLDSTWRGAGGGRYAPTANQAPKFAQNHIAWKLWKRSGWGPWSCA